MEKIENIGVDRLANALIELNQDTGVMSYLFVFEQFGEKVIVTDMDMSKATFPAGYYFSKKNGLTNKHRTSSGIYETINVMTLTPM